MARSTRPAGRKRCVYVDFLNTGPAVSKTTEGARPAHCRDPARRRPRGDRARHSRRHVRRCACRPHSYRASVPIAAKATILATGGLTRLYARNSASINMGGDGFALALRAGAELIDMEFVQFFPIGHLAPRLVGMDPIMWDPSATSLAGGCSIAR